MQTELEAKLAQKAALQATINGLASQPQPHGPGTVALLKAYTRMMKDLNAQIFILETGDYVDLDDIPF